MAEQIVFFKKSRCDISDDNVTVTASQGNEYARYVINRSNLSAWLTTGSVDADNTTLTVDMVDEKPINNILLLKHNFKSFTVKYWDGSAYQDFSPAISETTNTAASNRYEVESVATSRVQLTILGTQTANEDKYLYQLILTELIGQLAGWPIIKKPTHSRNRIKNKSLSGKTNIVENIGNFSTTLSVASLSSDADMTILENLYNANEGFLLWLCGGDETQFKTTRRQGYRLEDLYLMKCADEYQPELYQGLYKAGFRIEMDLTEVIE